MADATTHGREGDTSRRGVEYRPVQLPGDVSRLTAAVRLGIQAEFGGWELERGAALSRWGAQGRARRRRRSCRTCQPECSDVAAPMIWGMRAASAAPQERVEHPGAELQRVHRHPLVDAVEQRGEVQLRRQLQRGEAEAADAEVVRRTWRRCRRRACTARRARSGPRPAARRPWRRPARRRTSVSSAACRVHPLALDARAEELVEVGAGTPPRSRAGSGRRRCAWPRPTG